VLRGSGGEPQRSLNIPWVPAKEEFTVSALFSGKNLGRYAGKALQKGVLKLRLPPFGQEILELKPVQKRNEDSD
jgi:hypothetical protein